MNCEIRLLDDLFAAVDALARKLGIARSRLVGAALVKYIAKHRHARVTEQLDAVYAAEPCTVDEPLRRAQRGVLKRSGW